MQTNHTSGFTLIEVLIALLIIAIGLTALLKVESQNVQTYNRIKEKTYAHLIAMSALANIQLYANNVSSTQENTQHTKLFGTTWYWRSKLTPTSIHAVQQITITVSHRQTGPFTNRLIGYRYAP